MADVTQILSQIDSGDPRAAEQLLPLVYEELRKLAAAKLLHEKPGQTLQATALVHEAYLRMVNVDQARQWNSRAHFFRAAAEAMRCILVDAARRKRSLKRGGNFTRVEVDAIESADALPAEDVLAVSEALEKLAGHDADQLVVSARSGGGISLFVVDRGHHGVTLRVVETMDSHKAAMVDFDCTVEADRLLGDEGGGLAALGRALDFGAAASCAEGYGIMRSALAMTADYLRTREQFDAKIGSFQALQHRCVDMFIETQLAQSTAIMAAIKLSDPDESERQRDAPAVVPEVRQQLAQRAPVGAGARRADRLRRDGQGDSGTAHGGVRDGGRGRMRTAEAWR